MIESPDRRPWGWVVVAIVVLVVGGSVAVAMAVDHTTGSTHDCRSAPVVLEGEVTHVVDGDTLDVGSTRIRLAIVDTPETHNGVEPGGPEASEFSTDWAMGERIRVYRPSAPYLDPYGRTLGEVVRLRDCASLNVALVDAGLAQPMSRYCSDDPDLARRVGC